jgi:membrane-associated protein
MLFSVDHILQAGGLLAAGLIIFAECGLLVGFFLPGDTLLIPAGILASQHKLNIWLLLPTVAIAAIIGYQVGYTVGEKAGPKVFRRKGGLLFREDYIPRTQEFVRRHGGKSMILARFIAVVRTFIPVVAGVGKMPKRQFFFYNVIGAVIWTFSLTLGSYWVGQRVSHIDKFIIPIILIGILATAGGELWFLLRSRASRKQFFKALREEWGYLFGRGSGKNL